MPKAEPPKYLLVQGPEALEVHGLSIADIPMLFDWQDGKITLTGEDLKRMQTLSMLVLRTATD